MLLVGRLAPAAAAAASSSSGLRSQLVRCQQCQRLFLTAAQLQPQGWPQPPAAPAAAAASSRLEWLHVTAAAQLPLLRSRQVLSSLTITRSSSGSSSSTQAAPADAGDTIAAVRRLVRAQQPLTHATAAIMRQTSLGR